MSVAAMAGMMTLAACSSDDVVVNNDNDVQTIQIAVASTGDRATRSRDLNSEEPGQNIETVKVVIRNKATNAVVYVGEIDNWNNAGVSTEYTTDGHGRYATLSLTGDNRLKAGTYTITAVGYTAADFTDNTVADATKGNTLAGNFTAKVNGNNAQEAFAGESEITLAVDHAAIKPTVTLHRQVAGYYGYFTSIPVAINGKNVTDVRLVARSKNTKLEFGHFNSDFKETGSNVQYVVNGSETAIPNAKFNGSATDDAYELYDIKVKDWFSGDANGDGILDEKDAANWTNALADKGYQTYQKGTIFAGGFAVPFEAVTDKATLELQLLDADGNILKAMPVTMATAQPAGTVLAGNSTTTESTSAFSFFRNHMYTIGKKFDNTTTPGTTPDEPEPLDKTQNIVIRVNDNWEVINHLELGE